MFQVPLIVEKNVSLIKKIIEKENNRQAGVRPDRIEKYANKIRIIQKDFIV